MKEIKIYNEIGELLIHFYKSNEDNMWGLFCYDGQYKNGVYNTEAVMEIREIYKKIYSDIEEK